MCGIVGYVGSRQAAPLLLEGLKRLEYRGYDSAGLAVLGENGIALRRSVGKLGALQELLGTNPLSGSVGLGHTRWATHGPPTESNAHPHSDCSRQVALIHNGIIENHASLRRALSGRGHRFESETDTEVVAHLIEERLKGAESARPEDRESVLIEAVRKALAELEGAYALAVVWAGAPGRIVAAKTSSPLVVGLGGKEAFLASDVPAFLDHTKSAVFLEDGELAVLSEAGVRFLGLDGKAMRKTPMEIEWSRSMAEKGGHAHYMLKEIYEQPSSIENTLRGRLEPGRLDEELGLPPERLRAFTDVQIVACGTACHAGMIGGYLLEKFARLPVAVHTASEYRYREPIVKPTTLVIAISQSGETADTLAAVREAKSAGAKVLSVCNTVGSALTRASDFNVYTYCGPERGVASTKAFVGQIAALHLLAMRFAHALGRIDDRKASEWAEELSRLPSLVGAALKVEPQIREIAERVAARDHCIYIGRNVNYPTALEGALKLKEISYVHAEGYAAGEMKHGPIALIDDKMPVVAIATRSRTLEKVLSNIEEAKARGGRIIALCTDGESRLEGRVDAAVSLPPVGEAFSPIINSVPLQLLAYHVAVARGCDIDQPRNLAKSVTVE
jgi:glucosamine--fructose-6-phosphate aminotransferase (isomerizing)